MEGFWNYKANILLAIVLIFCGTLVELRETVLQRVTIESDRRHAHTENRTFSVPKSEALSGNFGNLSDVSLIALEGKIKSICVQSGLWAIFYSENYSQVAAILYTSGLPEDRACTNEAHRNGTFPRYNSIRHVGNRKLSVPGISFYLGPFFTLEELYFDGYMLNLYKPINVRSFGFTGKENWTVFSEANFSGSSACLLSDFAETLTYDAVAYNKDINITVGSLQRGCGLNLSDKDMDNRSKTSLYFPSSEVNLQASDIISKNDIANISNLLLRERSEDGVRGLISTDGELRLPEILKLNLEYEIGGSSNWTVFGDTNFESNGRCFLPKAINEVASARTANSTNDDSAGIFSTVLQIGSIKRGCFPEFRREPRVINQPKTVEDISRDQRKTYDDSPSHHIFFRSFLIALGILILIILLAIFTIIYFYIRRD